MVLFETASGSGKGITQMIVETPEARATRRRLISLVRAWMEMPNGSAKIAHAALIIGHMIDHNEGLVPDNAHGP